MRILLADDSPPHLELLKDTVDPLGHEVLKAEDGLKAWKAFQVYRPRIIIADWMMPELSGTDLCRRIREEMRREPGSDYTYFILVTAARPMNSANTKEAMEMEVDDFLAKPYDPEAIRGRIRVAERILGLSQRLKDLESLVPICAYCKRVRKDDGDYEAVETFVQKRAPLTFSHGICPDCKNSNQYNVR